MGKVRVSSYSISVDGYGAGPDQSVEHPLGRQGESLHEWMFATKTFGALYGDGGGADDSVDAGFARRGMDGLGAWILGRNMFGPVRGEWPDLDWRGWWGDNPPYHCPVFVLTQYPRPALAMEGGTVFHFVGSAQEALARARDAAGDLDIRVGGGAATIRHYLRSRTLDELHIAVAPVLLGGGEPLFAGLDLPALGYAVAGQAQGERAMHVMIARR